MIYILLCRATRDKQFVKIGYSKHPEKRMKEIQGMCPLKLKLICTFNGNLETERALHLYYLDKKLPHTREWFKCGGELKESVERFKCSNLAPLSIQDFICSFKGKRAKHRLKALQALQVF